MDTPSFATRCEEAGLELREIKHKNDREAVILERATYLLTAAAAMARDAERYRYIREHLYLVFAIPRWEDYVTPEVFDANVDAARSEK